MSVSFLYFLFKWRAVNHEEQNHKPTLKRVLLNPPTTDPPTTDQPIIDHLLTDSPTNRPPTHQPTNPITTDTTDKILFQILDQWRIFILQNANKDVKLYFGLLSIWWIDIFVKSLFIFIKSFSLVFFKRKLLFYKLHTEDLTMFIFLHFKPNCFTPSQIFTVYFYLRKFQ